MYSSKGFSLIELMITVGIIGILSLLAFPIYSNYMIRLRYTQLVTNALNIAKLVESAGMSGSDFRDESVPLASLLCTPGSMNVVVSNSLIYCKANNLFYPPQGLLPQGWQGDNLMISANMFQLSMSMTIKSDDSQAYYIFDYVAQGEDAKMQIFLYQAEGREYGLSDLYSTQKGGLLVKILIQKSPGAITVYDKELNKKLAHSGWYCGFSLRYLLFSPVQSSAMPSVCKYSYTGGDTASSIARMEFHEL